MNNTPTIKELFLSFFRLGLTAFGGPAMVAHIRELSTRRHQWLDETAFKNGVALCQSIPGATAIQAAAYVGLKVRGISGALAAYIGFGLPAFILMLILSVLYARFNSLPSFISLFNGLQVIVVAIIINATYAFGRNIANNYRSVIVALLSALLLWLGISPFMVIIVAGILGIAIFRVSISSTSVNFDKKETLKNAKQIIGLFVIFLICFTGLYFLSTILFNLAAVMLKIDLFAFGGGFASLPLMLHEIVMNRGWLDNKTFMDGIALGQVTPGPIIITATFVGYLVYGLLGAIVATIAIFTPSFFMVITIAPFFDRLKNSVYFMRAIDGIFASFVGLLLFVCIKFAITVPWDILRILLGLAALTALLRKVDILYIVPVGAVISVFVL
ncbi:MAG: chromate efflux transporter [Deltaproteobacteria bacterium]|nr:chromate efflux transporter [Deltaproteobacteria bacterium]